MTNLSPTYQFQAKVQTPHGPGLIQGRTEDGRLLVSHSISRAENEALKAAGKPGRGPCYFVFYRESEVMPC
jgi:hypothetical protein